MLSTNSPELAQIERYLEYKQNNNEYLSAYTHIF